MKEKFYLKEGDEYELLLKNIGFKTKIVWIYRIIFGYETIIRLRMKNKMKQVRV